MLISYEPMEFADPRAAVPPVPKPLTVNGSVYTCSHCQQAVRRDALGEVLHHEIPDHKPLP